MTGIDSDDDDGSHQEDRSPISLADEEDGLVVNRQKNQDYNLVAAAEDSEDVDDLGEIHLSSVNSTPRWQRILHATLLPDNKFQLLGARVLDGVFAVKLLKFLAFTFAGLLSMYKYIRWMDWEHDEQYSISDMMVYESTMIVQDAVVFFVVGRLHRQSGVDHLAWIAWAFLANLYSSYITNFRFLQHSFTLYEMHCRWPWKLWAFTGAAAVIVVVVAVMHIRRAVQLKVFVMKLTEMMVCFGLLMAPLLTSPYFHFHHWFAGFFFGMHFNFDVWWSRAVMAWCWGAYINGIAVYGRDPVLTCGYAYFLSVEQRCPYVSCYLDALAHPTYHNDTNNNTVLDIRPMVAPDWRNCSAEAFHA